jgi:hypothetical protein
VSRTKGGNWMSLPMASFTKLSESRYVRI